MNINKIVPNTCHIWILFILIFSINHSLAQNATIRGFIYEKETGEPIIFTNVYLYRTSLGAATDVNGFFAIAQVPPGDYLLMVTYLGYDTLSMPLTVNANDVITKKLYLSQSSVLLKEVNISGTREEARMETRTSVIKITPKQIQQIPSIGGQPDLAQYLQVLPGVIFTGDQGGQLYIRGGSPVQNKVLLDGMTIYNPFHSIGLFSVFDTEIIRNVEIYTGGFGAEFGGRISSVMNITTRDGNKRRLSGRAGISTFGAELQLEGPLKKENDTGGGTSSFILSAKNSYLEQSSKALYQYIDTAGLPFNYMDLYGKLSLNGSNGSKANFYGFYYSDVVNNYRALSDFNWNSVGGGVNFVVIPGKSPALMEGHIDYSNYKITLDEVSTPTRSSQINGFDVGLDFTYFLGKDVVKYGVELLGYETSFDYTNSLNRKIEQKENTTELGGYVKYKMVKGKFLIEPSFRLQWYASLGNISPEPRLALKYNATDKLRFKLAGGLYSQNLISARSDRDVVNLFYGFVSGPDNLQEEFDGKKVKHKLQKAEHIILGLEYDLMEYATFNLEGYYKNFSQLTNINRNKIYDDNGENQDKPYYLRKDFIIENGHAEGVEISFKYDRNYLYFWAAYSLAWVKMYDGQIEYYPHYDRRHNVNLVASYTFGSSGDWEANARWNFGSGFPFTRTQGFYEKLTFQDGINTDYTTENGELGIQYDDVNGGRLPYYHRLDISLLRRFHFGRYARLEATVGVTNLYNRNNVFYIDRITGERVDQLPFMPSAGMRFFF
ncbi:MAG: TonB-dependent receptor [Bacteroidetes bacterium]|nr:TonB-dependent receptor [Bacteroidota bacterium]